MDDTVHLSIEVAYALRAPPCIVPVRVAPGQVAREVLRLSNLTERFPEIDIASCPMGSFGRPGGGSYVVRAGDRIEVYRALERDPREVRRELAARGMTMGGLPGKLAQKDSD